MLLLKNNFIDTCRGRCHNERKLELDYCWEEPPIGTLRQGMRSKVSLLDAKRGDAGAYGIRAIVPRGGV